MFERDRVHDQRHHHALTLVVAADWQTLTTPHTQSTALIALEFLSNPYQMDGLIDGPVS